MAEAPAESGDPLAALAARASAASGPMRWVRLLADDIGSRRPTGENERRAAEEMRAALESEGLSAELEPFQGYATFAALAAVASPLALAPSLLPPHRRLLRSVLALAAAAAVATEGSLTFTPVSRALSRRPSQNLVAAIEPTEQARRTVCLVCHLDTSRSGLLFHPRLAAHTNRVLSAFAAAGLAQGAEPLLGSTRAGRAALGLSRLMVAGGAALLVERELRGEDTPGANDNASGTAVVAELALELVRRPLSDTRVVILMTGCEESGMLGARAFLESNDTADWLFLNFDNVGGDVPLWFLPREGVGVAWDADPTLCAIAGRVAGQRPELGMHRAEQPIGLTYDTTPVMARGGRAITFVAADEDGAIPNYHWPTDTSENVSPAAVGRALDVGREMLSAIDRGDADDPAQREPVAAESPG